LASFDEWRKESASICDEIASFKIRHALGAIENRRNPVRDFKGKRKWENPAPDFPTQQMRDALLNMIVYQGDTDICQRRAAALSVAEPPPPIGTVAPLPAS